MEYSIQFIFSQTFNDVITYEKAYLALAVFASETLSLEEKNQELLREKFRSIFSGENLNSPGNIAHLELRDMRNIFAHRNYKMNFNHGGHTFVSTLIDFLHTNLIIRIGIHPPLNVRLFLRMV